MRVMLLHKSAPDTEAGKVPPASLIAAVGQMIGAMKEADVFRDGAGLRPVRLIVRRRRPRHHVERRLGHVGVRMPRRANSSQVY
jgi:hypothetical protein